MLADKTSEVIECHIRTVDEDLAARMHACKDVGKEIMQWQKNGWRLHMYSCAQVSVGADAYHYLLFERGE